MPNLIIKAPAKINLTLDVTGKRSDGYHSVKTIMQTVSLYDEIRLAASDKTSVSTSVRYVPDDEGNIAHRAAQVFFGKTGIRGGATVNITKNIPVGAGLGGGSSNAAAVLIGLNRLYNASLGREQMEEMGLTLGADVPFFFTGGTCLAEGIGEVITPLDSAVKGWAVLVKPYFSINTKRAYKKLDSIVLKSRPDTDAMIAALKGGNIKSAAGCLCNVFEQAVFPDYPQTERIKKQLIWGGALGALMSGSGSAVFGIFDNKKTAQSCAVQMTKEAEGVYVAEFLSGGLSYDLT